MTPSVRLGRIAGVPVQAHWSALVLPLLIMDALATALLPHSVPGQGAAAYWVAGAAVAAAFVVSLCAHELAHALVARRKGRTVRSVTLWMLGGMTVIEGDASDPRSELAIAIAGPVTSFLCGAASGGLALGLMALHGHRLALVGAAWLAATNVVLAVFNLLPGSPLDGGRVLSALVWRHTGDRSRARATAARTGRTTGVALMTLGAVVVVLTGDVVGGLWLAVIGWYLLTAATGELALAQVSVEFAQVEVHSVMDPRVTLLPAYQPVGVAARHAVEADAHVCPVVSFNGEVVGLVRVDDVLRAVRDDPSMPVSAVMGRLPAGALTTPDTPLLQALERSGGRLPLIVLDNGQVTGMVTSGAIRQARRRQLAHLKPVG